VKDIVLGAATAGWAVAGRATLGCGGCRDDGIACVLKKPDAIRLL
jgi:hypothetical protein